MTNNWHKIWSLREYDKKENESILECLIKVNGYDTPLGKMTELDFREYVDNSVRKLNLTNNESVFEIGCGAGAFLYVLNEKGFEVSGIDYSQQLIDIAKKTMPKISEKFQLCDAIDLMGVTSDVIIANHVFHYFPNLKYASKVLANIIKSKSKVLITALPDIALKNESEAFRKGILTPQEYNKKYKGLNILYFSKSWILNEIEKISPEKKVLLFPHNMPKFLQNKYRFDCLIL